MKSTQPLVSVIIPCYNVEEFIFNTIKKITKQTYQNLEIICIDDGSTDSTGVKLREVNEKYGISVYAQNNKGAALARKLGVDKAKGEYIVFIDADDYIENRAIEYSISYMNKNLNRVDSVVWEFHTTNGITSKPFVIYEHERVLDGQEAFLNTIGTWKITGMGVFKREIIKQAYNQYSFSSIDSYNSDEYITRLIFLCCASIATLKIKYFYYNNEASTTRKFSKGWLKVFQTNELIKKLMKKEGVYKEYKLKIIDQQSTDVVKLYFGYRNNKSLMSASEKIEFSKECMKGVKSFSVLEYLSWCFWSRKKIKNKLGFIYSCMYFCLQRFVL
ncbi:glycosyltransferase family 2 protein [Vibrio alginolyticus]|uniref:glycosyltransferase family 2 protein n=1 Tax=Vibrio alginolyticus TaxID=663 RepID=UPI0021CE2BCB